MTTIDKSTSKITHVFSLFEWILIISIITLDVVAAIINKQLSIVECIMTVAGVLNVVLVAKGEISNYLFGIIQSVLYAYLCWKNGFWGQMALFALYFLPMQFVGYFEWKKHLVSEDGTKVQTRNLNLRQMLIVYFLTVVVMVVVAFLLQYFKGSVPYLDSATTVLNITAMLLMVKGYSDQWYLWIVINIASIILWLIKFSQGVPGGLVVSAMWLVYLVNSVYGLILWRKGAVKAGNNI